MQREVLSEQTASIMTSYAGGGSEPGTGSSGNHGGAITVQLPAAGKTGNNIRIRERGLSDTRRRSVRRCGSAFDKQECAVKTWDGQGGRAAAPIWGRFMKYVYDDPNIAMPLQYILKSRRSFAGNHLRRNERNSQRSTVRIPPPSTSPRRPAWEGATSNEFKVELRRGKGWDDSASESAGLYKKKARLLCPLNITNVWWTEESG